MDMAILHLRHRARAAEGKFLQMVEAVFPVNEAGHLHPFRIGMGSSLYFSGSWGYKEQPGMRGEWGGGELTGQ